MAPRRPAVAFALVLALAVAVAAPAWENVADKGFGDPLNSAVRSMAVLAGALFAGTANSARGCEIWTSANGTDWTPSTSAGFGDPANLEASAMAVLASQLYVGTSNEAGGCEVWRTATGSSRELVADGGFADPSNVEAMSMAVLGDALYVGTRKRDGGCEVWRTGDGSAWSQVDADGFGNQNNEAARAMAVYDGRLHVAVDNSVTGPALWRTSDGDSWESVELEGLGDSTVSVTALSGYGTHLYAGTAGSGGRAQLWRSRSGAGFVPVVTDGWGDPANQNVASLVGFQGELLAVTASSTTGCEVWSSAFATAWTQTNVDGFDGPANLAGPSTAVLANAVYVGTDNPSGGCEVLRMPATVSARYVRPDGVDTGACDLPAAACASLAYAVTQALDGDVVRVAEGTYTGGALALWDAASTLTFQGGWSADFSGRSGDPGLTVFNGIDIRERPGGFNLTMEGFTLAHANIEISPGCNSPSPQRSAELNLSRIVVRGNKDRCGVYYNTGMPNSIVITVADSVFLDNYTHVCAWVLGGPAVIWLTNVTFAGDSRGLYACADSGGYGVGHIQVHLTSTLTWGNSVYATAVSGSHAAEAHIYASYSDVGPVNVGGDATYTPGAGMLSVDPRFVGGGDYHLSPDSPCVDAGTNLFWGPFDFEGDARPADGNGDGTARADIGADEVPDPALFRDGFESGDASAWSSQEP